MSPCHPTPLPTEDGCLVRRIGESTSGKFHLWSLTYWTGGKLYQMTIFHPEQPTFGQIEDSFEMHTDRWTPVSLPISPAS